MRVTEFARRVEGTDLNCKLNCVKVIKEALRSGKHPDGSSITSEELKQLSRLQAWLITNILIGNELCPADSIIL